MLDEAAFESPLGAVATSVEGRYKVRPGMYGAARIDRVDGALLFGKREDIGGESRRHAAQKTIEVYREAIDAYGRF